MTGVKYVKWSIKKENVNSVIHLKSNIWLLSFLKFWFWFIFHENGPAWISWNIQSIHFLGFRFTCQWSFYAAWIWWRCMWQGLFTVEFVSTGRNFIAFLHETWNLAVTKHTFGTFILVICIKVMWLGTSTKESLKVFEDW